MNQQAFEKILYLFDSKKIKYRVFSHPECRTSEESARVRAEAGVPEAVGAKALLCKVDFKEGSEFVVFVLPGIHSIDKQKLKNVLPNIRQFRFSTKDELLDIAGVVPGCMPPFGSQLFANVSKIYVAKALELFPVVAFNAAKLDTSIVLSTEDYLLALTPTGILDFSKEKVT
jgi:Ala-tRNA(Pro) deacylase